MNTGKEHAQDLLDQLAPDQIAAVVHVMEVMLDPFHRRLSTAPLEDEEIDAGEQSAASSAREWLRHNQPIPHEDVLDDLGLTMSDYERMARTPRAAGDKRPSH
jgi:hypothetical protein